ncbi:hypothetical protein [Corynebacterium freneyi]|uniref:hypothetical protein n=1 Tax=Corynebacterium freneyi TaxID=134034 RepID=UPI0012EBA2D9|nr:hypothetical protein [Corynebacterium freneyi]
MSRQILISFALAALAAGAFWILGDYFDSVEMVPLLCCFWLVAGLVAMGRLRDVQLLQLVLASIAAMVTVGTIVYYNIAAGDNRIGALALVSLFLVFSAQVFLRWK